MHTTSLFFLKINYMQIKAYFKRVETDLNYDLDSWIAAGN